MLNIAICICTRNRQEELQRLLNSIENLLIPDNTNIRIVIVENELKSRSENIIKELSSKSKFRISYYLETRQGLSYARNRSVKETHGSDFCCFVDDDQIVAKDWLIELLKCQNEFNADGVYGSTPPVFSKKVPLYIEYCLTRKIYPYGTILNSAATGCLLLRKNYLELIDGPFDIRLNFIGGEDSYLTNLITKNGGVIRYNPNAIAYEIIPDNKATIKGIIKRTYIISNRSLFVELLKDSNFFKLKKSLRLGMRLCLGLLIVIPFFLFGKTHKLEGLIKISNALGGFSFILGKTNQFYK
jgi:succinoglycan biosynthesis protein ExoM